MSVNRRNFLKLGLSGAALAALGPVFRSPLLTKALHAATLAGSAPKKLIVIFLRGGNDGVNTCIPFGDSEYNQINRPTLFIPEAQSIDLGNGFARLHPALANLNDVFVANDLAILHRVAYANQSRSHFDSQHYWENAIPGSNLEEGWLYRHLDEYLDIPSNPLAAASISDQLMLILKGDQAISHIPDVANYAFGPSGSPEAEKLLGHSPNGSDPGSGILGWYGQPVTGVDYDGLVKSTGVILGESIVALEEAGVDPATYVPENGATYPSADNPQGFGGGTFLFFRRLRDAAMLAKLTDMQIIGLEAGGFDTHAQQGQAYGVQANLLAMVGHGVRSLSLDLQDMWDDMLVLTVSEFGRTSEENGSFGTDHGEASVQFVAGGSVNGGVYNCDATTWADGDMLSTPNGRYVAHLTDFRSMFAEVLTRHLGVDTTTLDIVIPGYSSHAGDPKFDFLNFLPV